MSMGQTYKFEKVFRLWVWKCGSYYWQCIGLYMWLWAKVCFFSVCLKYSTCASCVSVGKWEWWGTEVQIIFGTIALSRCGKAVAHRWGWVWFQGSIEIFSHLGLLGKHTEKGKVAGWKRRSKQKSPCLHLCLGVDYSVLSLKHPN